MEKFIHISGYSSQDISSHIIYGHIYGKVFDQSVVTNPAFNAEMRQHTNIIWKNNWYKIKCLIYTTNLCFSFLLKYLHIAIFLRFVHFGLTKMWFPEVRDAYRFLILQISNVQYKTLLFLCPIFPYKTTIEDQITYCYLSLRE